MKTKIIYVLVSNENDCYLEQALVSIYSLRLYNPDANLLLLVDEETSRTLENGIRKLILNYVSKLVIVDVPFHYSKQQKSRYIKTSLRSQVIGDFLFIDCDTIINEELKDIDNLSCEIAAVPDCHLSIKYSWMKTIIVLFCKGELCFVSIQNRFSFVMNYKKFILLVFANVTIVK